VFVLPEIKTTPEVAPAQPHVDFRITDFHLGEGGPKTRYNWNTEAIRTLRRIEAGSRRATPEEQAVLSRYVGWGGLPQVFDGGNTQWAKEHAELEDLLSEGEYESARASTLNAHYTSPVVIQAMYEAVGRMGFKKGNILEPACGVGNFLGMLPESMGQSKLYGVELDSVTGRIAQNLYQNADIRVTGFEKTGTPDALFDLAIGNVPFGGYGVTDRRYDRHRFHIHDYFFAKTLDQVRPGGLVAFITSQGTMDKRNPAVRRYIAERAELLGAVRLPNNAFLKNAGTEVTTDIVFLQKRERVIDVSPGWLHLGELEDGIPVNSYFASHPEMILGKMERGDKLYGNQGDSTSCHPIEGADLAAQLREALSLVGGRITEPEADASPDREADKSIPADPEVRNFSFAVIGDTVYFRENSRMLPVRQSAVTLARIRGMVALRDCAHALIDRQLHDHGDAEIHAKQMELDRLHDSFTARHGLVSSTANSRAFSGDSSYHLLASLEILDRDGNLSRKADIFTKRTIRHRSVATSVDTASEALAVSIGEKAGVDLPYMAKLTGFTEEKVVADLEGVIFRDTGDSVSEGLVKDFDSRPYVTADEYLSGNVRQKLETARRLAENLPPGQAASIRTNVAALEQAQPKDLDASEISVRLGSTWVDRRHIRQFVGDILELSGAARRQLRVDYSAHTGEWNVSAMREFGNVRVNVTYGTPRVNAFRVIEESLNLRDVRVYDTVEEEGRRKSVLNHDETTSAQQKQEAVRQAFRDWVFEDPERRRELVETYNRLFNSTRPREYDGSHLNFSGISPDIILRPHQLNAVAHILYGGNTLLAHEVGAGKTFEMVAAAMEAKRLGLCQKSLFAVPNHLTEQWAGEFLRLYPSANILVATARDFETGNRKRFCARIATGDYDAVIIGHSQMDKIPISRERQERMLREQIAEIVEGIRELKESGGERFTVKQMENTKYLLETKLKRLNDDGGKDDVVTFEQLGCDRLFVDEAHSFKNLYLYTKMRNIAGIPQTEAKKSSDLFLKCRYLDEATGGRGIVFATGTPISNSMTEMYTMQRYLQYDALERKGLRHFDAWASTFGETVTATELAPEGTGYRARTRFARFYNLPELMCMFKEVADIKTADMLDLPKPKACFHTVAVQPSAMQRAMVGELSRRAAAVHDRKVEPNEDNMLKITSDGRKIGLDQRLMNPLLPDYLDSKVNACADNIYGIWRDTAEDRSAQLVFCDFSTPNGAGRFNVYDDIRGKLVGRGVPPEEIAFIHDADTEARKKELFAKVREGDVRVMFGSTAKMGAGTNVQDRLVHLHDLDCPWRPSDLEQRAGRIVRQGNRNPEVHVTRYVTEGTFDAYLYQTVETKQKFISQVMTGKSPVRSCEDVDEAALSYAEIKALCAGNPLIREKMELDIDVARLKLLKADYASQRYRLQDAILKTYPEAMEQAKERIAGCQADIGRLAAGTVPDKDGFSPMELMGKTYAEKEEAGKALIEVCKGVADTDPVKVGMYRGFGLLLSFDAYGQDRIATLKGALKHQTVLGTDVRGNITRLNNVLADLPSRLELARQSLENTQRQLETAKGELEKPFPMGDELAAKSERLAALDIRLNMDASSHGPKDDGPESEPETEAVAPVGDAGCVVSCTVPRHCNPPVAEMGM
jgi:N12 class adenine-specific DNA methylase